MKFLGPLLAASAVASLGLAAGCKSETAPPDSPPSASASPTEAASPSPGATPTDTANGVPEGEPIDSGTIGGDGSELRLSALTGPDMAGANLAGELACSFTRTGDDAPILLAKGNVGSADRALAIIGFAGGTERLVAAEAGGFDAIIEGGRFGGKGLTVDVRRGKAPMPGASGESPPYPAALRAMRADGAERSLNGTWTCGP